MGDDDDDDEVKDPVIEMRYPESMQVLNVTRFVSLKLHVVLGTVMKDVELNRAKSRSAVENSMENTNNNIQHDLNTTVDSSDDKGDDSLFSNDGMMKTGVKATS